MCTRSNELVQKCEFMWEWGWEVKEHFLTKLTPKLVHRLRWRLTLWASLLSHMKVWSNSSTVIPGKGKWRWASWWLLVVESFLPSGIWISGPPESATGSLAAKTIISAQDTCAGHSLKYIFYILDLFSISYTKVPQGNHFRFIFQALIRIKKDWRITTLPHHNMHANLPGLGSRKTWA